MNLQTFIELHLRKKTILSYLLYPFSIVYCAVVMVRRTIYTLFPRLSYHSPIKIISVGNITTGGTGKTPFVMYLANHLLSEGKKIAIVLRGYKSGNEKQNVLCVSGLCPIANIQNNLDTGHWLLDTHSGHWLLATGNSHLGDEAIQYTQNLPNTPICVGKNRIKSIKLLEQNYPDLDYIIMDDAFQHLEVFQDIKILIINALNPFGNGFCLPAGLLREPLSHLQYADYFIINGDTGGDDSKSSAVSIDYRHLILHKPILFGSYIISAIKDFDGNTIDIDTLKDKKLTLLSGIGMPQSFEQTIKKAGLSFTHHIIQKDHFKYSQDFIDSLLERFRPPHTDHILTTEKDYTKLSTLKVNLPILVVCIKFSLNSNS